MIIFENGNPAMNEIDQDQSDSNAKSSGIPNKLSGNENNQSKKMNNS